MNGLRIVFSIVFITSLQAGAATLPNEKWSRCSTDEDCIELHYSCAGGVVNKRFLKEANAYYQTLNSQMNCIETPPTEAQKKLPYKVFCKSNKCGVQGVNPNKPGFS